MSLDQSAQTSPFVTGHAGDQWDARTDADSVAPETAWEHGQRIDANGPPPHADEIRLHHDSRALLLRRGPVVTTVLPIDDLTESKYHAVKHALPDDINP